MDPSDDEIPENNDRIVHSTVSTVYFFDDVEGGNTIWETNSAGEVYRWEIVDDATTGGGSYSTTHSWKLGFFGDGGGTLPTQRLYLQTANISVPGGGAVYLSFFHKYFLGELQERQGFAISKTDRSNVLISVDGGAWMILETFEFSQNTWELSNYPISSYISLAGSDVRIRFDIYVRVLPKSGGWWIDDIALMTSPPEEGLVLRIYEDTDSVNPGGYAGFLLKLTNVGDTTDTFRFGIDVLINGWSAYLSQNASLGPSISISFSSLVTYPATSILLSLSRPTDSTNSFRPLTAIIVSNHFCRPSGMYFAINPSLFCSD